MSGVSYTFATYLGTLLECVMYGIFLSFFVAACYIQWEKSSKGRGLNPLIVLATGFFGLTVTAHLIISLIPTVGAILHNPSGGTIHLSMGPPLPTDVIVSFAILYFQIMVADVIVVYRMYHIYDENHWMCVVPSITIIASLIAGCGLVQQFRNPIFNERVYGAWTAASFSLTTFNSLFLTAAISYKLWRVHREATRAGLRVEDPIILRAMKVLIESAALLTAFATINFFAGLAKSNLVYTFVMMSSPAVGISFCLIIARLGQISPEAQEETWHVSVRTPASRTSRSDQVAVSFPQLEILRGVYVSDSKDFPTETLESQNQEYANSSDGSLKVFRCSLSLHS